MAAPAGLTGGSVPETTGLEPPDPGAAGETGGQSALAVADPEPDEAVPVTDPVSVAHPGPDEAASIPDPGPDEAVSVDDPRPDETASVAGAAPGPTEPVAGSGPTRRTSLLAVAAVILGLIALAGVAVAILAVATHGFRAKSVVQYRVAAVFSLRPGDCLNSLPNGADVTLLSCSAPHDAEVFATFSLAPSTWPGAAAVQSQAGNGCQSRIASYLNPQLANAGLAQEYYYPDQAAWGAGVRTVVCEVSASTGQLTGSVRAPA
ncbi:MAG TPA: septum formation family protein [Streptosporangiaceae bacterium]